MSASIPVARPDIGALEQEYAADAVASGWISSIGPYIERFEQTFGTAHEAPHAAACSNGTAALHLALLAAGVGPGDEVVVPALTFVATANAVLHCGATPVLADVDEDTLTLDADAAAAAVTPRTKAIVPVHLYGHPADLDPLLALATDHRLIVIEDAAEAHGARYRGRRVGAIGHLGTFSFFGNKILTTGEGGMVTTTDPAFDQRVRLLRGQAVHPERRYWFEEVGYNYRLTNVAAAIGCAQVERLEELLAARRRIDGWYREALAGLDDRLVLPAEAPWAEPVCWVFTIRLRGGDADERGGLERALAGAGIETRPVFPALHHLPHLATGQSLPVSERAAAAGISLPTSVQMGEADVERVTGAVARHLATR